MKLKMLAVCGVAFQLMVFVPMASAEYVSSDKLKTFLQSKIYQCTDMDGYYGCQCVDLMRAYMSDVFGLNINNQGPRGSAYAIFKNFGDKRIFTNGYQRIKFTRYYNTRYAVPRKGDIVFWNSNEGQGYGHVAIYLAGRVNGTSSDKLVTLDQNWFNASLYAGSPARIVSHSFRNVAGWIRPEIL